MENWMESVVLGTLLMLFLHPFCGGVHANDESDALLAFKSKLSDPRNLLRSWDPELNTPCTWFHVTCEGDSVTRVDLGNSGISGQLAPELGRLKSLKYLGLYQNNLNGPIPSELGDLPVLETLDLSKNSLTGPPPASFGRLSNLKFLRLNNNKLSGCIPTAAWKSLITHLVVKDLTNNPGLFTCPAF